MSEITVDHILQACAWAKTAREAPQPIDGQKRRYDQRHWDCGTACCIWGAASILSGNGLATSGPPAQWTATDAQHALLAALMKSSRSTPEEIAAVAANADLRGVNLRGAELRGVGLSAAGLRGADLSGADLRYADLRGADLSGAILCGADLSAADLRDAELRGADLRDAELRGAVIELGNRRCLIQ